MPELVDPEALARVGVAMDVLPRRRQAGWAGSGGWRRSQRLTGDLTGQWRRCFSWPWPLQTGFRNSNRGRSCSCSAGPHTSRFLDGRLVRAVEAEGPGWAAGWRRHWGLLFAIAMQCPPGAPSSASLRCRSSGCSETACLEKRMLASSNGTWTMGTWSLQLLEEAQRPVGRQRRRIRILQRAAQVQPDAVEGALDVVAAVRGHWRSLRINSTRRRMQQGQE